MEVLGFVTDDLREWRRLQALALKRQGWFHRDIAAALGVSEVSVSQWLSRARDHGPAALLARPAPGPASKLSEVQQARIPEFLWHGPEAYGFRGRVWTRARVARVIEEEFGVRYHPGPAGLASAASSPGPGAAGGTSRRFNGGGRPLGPSCGREPDVSGGPWYSWTKRASTCCRVW
jgi:transposase